MLSVAIQRMCDCCVLLCGAQEIEAARDEAKGQLTEAERELERLLEVRQP
jgi:hypothetical protein